MKKKILLDIFLTAIWTVLMVYSLTGSFWHEALGLFISALFLVHVLINYKWIFAVSKTFFKKKLTQSKIMLTLDVLLLIFVSFTAVSGILISKELLTIFTVADKDYLLWVFLHGLAAYLSFILISVHIGIHWKMILGVFRSLLRLKRFKKARTVAANMVGVLIILYGIKASFTYQLPQLASSREEEKAADVSITTQSNLSVTKMAYTEAQSEPADGESLEDYLSRLICTGCSRRCPLSSPRCNIGIAEAARAETVYEAYSSESGNSSSQPSENDSSSSTQTERNSSESESSQMYKTIDLTIDNNASKVFSDILPMMGMYVAGTYYIAKFLGSRKNRGEKE